MVNVFRMPARTRLRAAAGLVLVTACGLNAGEKREDLPWSFHALTEQPLPAINEPAWPQNRIDRFILAGMEKAGLRPATPADDRVLL